MDITRLLTLLATRRRGVIAAAVGFLATTGCSDRVVGPTPASAAPDTKVSAPAVTPASIAWQQTASVFVVRYRVAAPAAARIAALLGLAQYAGVEDPGRGGEQRFEFEADGGQGHPNGHPSDRGAIAGASAVMLGYLFPLEATNLEAMVRQQEAMEVGAASLQFARGETRGREAAMVLVARARTDRFDAVWTGTVPTGDPRAWISTSAPLAFPTMGQMQPFLLQSGSQFRPGPPPSATSPSYLDDLAEVKRISGARTAEQITIAQFWAMSTGTAAPAGYWAGRAAGLIVRAGMGEREAAHVFALVGTAEMDALIGCWDAKYTYWLWRPTHAAPAPAITLAPGLTLPNHPSYPSGHSCGSAAAGEVLSAIFPFEAALLRAEVAEAGRSRVYAGIHFQFDCDVGQELGRNVAAYTLERDRDQGILNALR